LVKKRGVYGEMVTNEKRIVKQGLSRGSKGEIKGGFLVSGGDKGHVRVGCRRVGGGQAKLNTMRRGLVKASGWALKDEKVICL